MPVIGVFSAGEEEAEACAKALESWDASHLILPSGAGSRVDELTSAIDGLLITGRGDLAPNWRPQERVLDSDCSWEASGSSLLTAGLGIDLPILAIGRGFQLLNILLRGSLLSNVLAHSDESPESERGFARHRIWISPGSKLANALGSGGRVRVTSEHGNGIREAQSDRKRLRL